MVDSKKTLNVYTFILVSLSIFLTIYINYPTKTTPLSSSLKPPRSSTGQVQLNLFPFNHFHFFIR